MLSDSFVPQIGNGIIDTTNIDPNTLLPRITSTTLGTTPDPLVKTIRYTDPLVLDLDGDGLEITPLSKGVLFDSNGDTIKTGTAWVGADDGMLVWDRDGNGSIDSGKELFGDETVLANGQKAANGFAALSELDTGRVVNGVTVGAGDGVFDANDAQYANLRVWRDLNQDGISQTGEMQTLAESGVQSIKLTSATTSVNYGDAELVQRGSYTRADGSTGQAGSFILAQNNFVREFTPITVSDAAKTVSNIGGSGWVRDLQEAATQSPELIDLFNQAKDAGSRADYKAAVANLLREWGNDSGYNSAGKQALAAGYGLILSDPQDEQERGWMDTAIKASDADRNAYRATLSTEDLAKFDAMRERMVGGLEKIYAYEAFTGYTFLNWNQIQGDAFFYQPRYLAASGAVPVEVWVPLTQIIAQTRNAVPAGEPGYIRVTIPAPVNGSAHIDTLWNRLVEDATVNLSPLLRLSKYLDMVDLTISDAGISFDFSRLNAGLAAATAADKTEGTATILDLYRSEGAMLDSMGWDSAQQLSSLMQQAATDADVRQGFSLTGFDYRTAAATSGSDSNDAFGGDANANTFDAGAGDDILDGQGGNDNLSGGIGNDLLFGGDGNDDLYGQDGDDKLDGGAGDDNIRGGNGNDTLIGGAGNDALSGGAGNDTFDGGAGNDIAYGDGGNDTYLFGKGDGQDMVVEFDTTAGNVDQIIFKAGVSASDVRVGRDGDMLVLTINSTGDQLRVQSYFNADATNGSQVEEIHFTDSPSTVWTVADIKAQVLAGTAGNDYLVGYASADTINGLDGNDDIFGRDGDDVIDGGAGNDNIRGENGNDILNGGVGNDTLSGGAGNNTFDGGAGNDTIYGDIGNDTYLFGKGDGQDTLIDFDTATGNFDQIIFKAGVAVSDVQVSRDGDALVLTINGTGDQMRVQTYFSGDGTNGSQVEEIRFTDSPSTVWTLADVKTLALAATSGNDYLVGYSSADVINGLDGNDDIFGRDGDDVIDGGAGDDNIRGESGNDTLIGGVGNDALSGGAGNDTFDGGAGNDITYGDGGNDTYLFGKGDGQDMVIDYDATVGNTDQIIFKSGVTTSDVRVGRDGDTLILTINSTGDQLRVQSYFNGDATNGSQVEEIRFTDAPSTVWSIADVKAMALTGSAGNDYLAGYASADVINGLDGNDDIFGRDGDDVIDGGAGDDNIRGENGNDTLNGGAGNDTLNGGTGNDTYLFGKGDGQDTVVDYDTTDGNVDQIIFKAGVAVSDVQASRSGDTLLLKISGTSDQIQVSGYFSGDASQIEEIRFADAPNTVWTVADVKSLVLSGTTGNDYLVGTASADVINGFDGNDDIFGRDGDDVIDGGAGDDSLRGENGNDTLIGGAGNDSLSGGAGNNTFDGGTGNDTIYGDVGNDTYLFGKGDGQDTIFDYDTTAGHVDQIIFKAGVAASDVQAVRSGDTLVLKINGTNDQIQVSGYFSGDAANGSQIEEIRFTDAPNTVWTVDDVKAKVLTGGSGNDYLLGYASADVINGGDGNDDIFGRDGDDVIDGGLGDDNIRGENGNDTMIGGAGNDALSGGSGNDTFDGGAGNDTIYGDSGNDTFLFGKGDGQDTVFDYDTTAGNTDQIVFKAGVAASDVQAVRSGDTLVLKINGTSDQIQVSGYFSGDGTNGSQIEEIRFTDSPNTVWSVTDVKSQVLTGTAANDYLTGFSGADVINGLDGNDDIFGRDGDDVIDGGLGDDNIRGENGNDTMIGGLGNDALSGGAGDDTFNGGAGNDIMYGDGGNDTYVLSRGDGVDTIVDTDSTEGNTDVVVLGADIAVDQLWFSQSGNNLDVSILGTTDKFSIQNWYSGSQYHVEQIKTSDGKTLLDSQVQNLVSAMASFGVPPSSQTAYTADESNALQPVIAANWH